MLWSPLSPRRSRCRVLSHDHMKALSQRISQHRRRQRAVVGSPAAVCVPKSAPAFSSFRLAAAPDLSRGPIRTGSSTPKL